jgi:hypothetical protein
MTRPPAARAADAKAHIASYCARVIVRRGMPSPSSWAAGPPPPPPMSYVVLSCAVPPIRSRAGLKDRAAVMKACHGSRWSRSDAA